jgi:hypothetical protein
MKDIDALVAKIVEISKKKAISDSEDFNAYDWFGGNFDDAYSGGAEDGEVFLARALLHEYIKE